MAVVYLADQTPVFVDDSDVWLVSRHPWHLKGSRGGYAWCQAEGYMHRMLLSAPKGAVVDHINGNRLDNRRANLRLATVAQNCQNRRRNAANVSGHKGVGLHACGRWRARIQVDGHSVMLGLFDNVEDAAKAYADAASFYFGAFARI